MAGCKYCKHDELNESLIVKRTGLGTLSAFMSAYIDGDGTLYYGSSFGSPFCETEIIHGTKKIKYCPMCGRKLQKGETNG